MLQFTFDHQDLDPRWRGMAHQAAEAEIAEVDALGGSGGVIVMTDGGKPAFAMNTSGMYRGAVSSSAPATVAIYADENDVP